MSKVRVLIVDDSIMFRRLLTGVLQQSSEIEVVGDASNGKLALTKVDELKPDVVTLDVEMPVMNGIECLKLIKERHPGVTVIMFSGQNTKSATMTIEALTLGASGFVAKPTSDSPAQSATAIEADLVPLITGIRRKAPAPRGARSASAGTGESSSNGDTISRLAKVHRSALVIGVSTGGPNALQEIVPKLPASFRVPVLVVQHMPPVFTRQLAERLNDLSPLKVVEAEHGMSVEPRTVYLAPGDFHMEVDVKGPKEQRIVLHQGPRENSCRPAVDPLFRSAAKAWGRNCLGLVLTGMGADGAIGAEALKAAGAAVIAQDEATSVVWGMPQAVVQKGAADLVLPLPEIAPTLLKLV